MANPSGAKSAPVDDTHAVSAALAPDTQAREPDAGEELDARLLGKTLGETYRVKRVIGAGGMGRVYEAEHILLGKRFALKVLDARAATHRDAVARFFAEARARRARSTTPISWTSSICWPMATSTSS